MKELSGQDLKPLPAEAAVVVTELAIERDIERLSPVGLAEPASSFVAGWDQGVPVNL